MKQAFARHKPTSEEDEVSWICGEPDHSHGTPLRKAHQGCTQRRWAWQTKRTSQYPSLHAVRREQTDGTKSALDRCYFLRSTA